LKISGKLTETPEKSVWDVQGPLVSPILYPASNRALFQLFEDFRKLRKLQKLRRRVWMFPGLW